ncbi:hypothetical protein [Roseateles sp.]|uniref:hypothetical protein n=1 Tax=Roseateles sp. TaxID=1971397 RepID=UPI003BACC4E0
MTDAEKNLLALGVMAYASSVEPGLQRCASSAFYGLVQLARKKGFRESTKLSAGLRSGKATPKVVERIIRLNALLPNCEVQRALEHADWWHRNVTKPAQELGLVP